MKNTKQFICLIISCLFLFGFHYLPIDIGLTTDAMKMVGIFIGAIIMWLGIGIDWPSLIVLFALSLLPDSSVSKVMSNAFGNNTVWFLVFSCILTYSLSATGVLKTIALWFINTPFAKKGAWHFMAMYFLSILIIGSFIAPTVLFVLFFALAKEIYSLLNLKEGSNYAKAMMIGTAIMTSISCAMTPIAHTFPIMALGYYSSEFGKSINWIHYMSIGIPAGLIVAIITFIILKKTTKWNDEKPFTPPTFKIEPLTKQGIISLVIFGITVLMWLLDGLVAKTSLVWLHSLSTTGIALIGAILCCIFANLNFKDAITKGVPWTSIILCATTLCVGSYLTSDTYGIVTLIGNSVSPLVSNLSTLAILLLVTSFVIIMTNLMSNIVTTRVAYSLLTPVILATGITNPYITTIIIGMGASMAYATPPAIAHIALAAGSGYCDSKDMLKHGGIASIVSIIVLTILAYILGLVFKII